MTSRSEGGGGENSVTVYDEGSWGYRDAIKVLT